MKRRRLAIIGFGKVGRTCAQLIIASKDLSLAGVVRRPETMMEPLPEEFRSIPVVSFIGELTGVEAALVCVPPSVIAGVAHDVLQNRIPLVDCAKVHGEDFQAHKEAIHRATCRHKVPAILGAGWDPGALSLFRSLFGLLTPHGHTTTVHRSGKDLHHAMMVEHVSGVKEALCTERRTAEGKLQRYVYVEVENGADQDRVIEAIQADPLFLEEETFVFPVESVAALEEQGQGVSLERWGSTGATGHQHLLLEARFDVLALAAQMMVASSRILPLLSPGAYSFLELPVSHFFGEEFDRAEKEFF